MSKGCSVMKDDGTAHLPVPSTDDWMQHPPYGLPPDKNDRRVYYTASCHCKRVQYAILTDEPMEAKFCHCTDCHKLFGSPAQWVCTDRHSFYEPSALLRHYSTHFLPLSGIHPPPSRNPPLSPPPSLPPALTPSQTAMLEKTDVHFLSGVDNLAFYHLADSSHERKLPCKIACRTCRSPVMDEGRKILVIYPSLIDFDELPVGDARSEGKSDSTAKGGEDDTKMGEDSRDGPMREREKGQLILKAKEGELALGKRKRGSTSTKGGLTPEDGKKKFFPTCHIFYEQRVDDYVDGKPKYKGHKEDGETIPEHEW